MAPKLPAREGFVFGFHNHGIEFQNTNGFVPDDVLLASTDPAHVKLELDLYWMSHFGGDPLAYFKNNPGRYRLVHVEDVSKTCEVTALGDGTLDFPRLLAAAKAAGFDNFFVEYDRPPPPMLSPWPVTRTRTSASCCKCMRGQNQCYNKLRT